MSPFAAGSGLRGHTEASLRLACRRIVASTLLIPQLASTFKTCVRPTCCKSRHSTFTGISHWRLALTSFGSQGCWMFSVRSSEESEGKSADLGMSCAGNSGRLLLLMPPFLECAARVSGGCAPREPCQQGAWVSAV